jgi:selenide, water dikinase
VAKLAPSDLAQVLSKLPKQVNENVIVGFETADDAGVFRLSDDIALVQTLDFFTPVADDPEMYGRIAAVNSLNDVYAMGGTPLSALSMVCYPQKGDWDVLEKILRGGQAAMTEAGVPIIGGHSVDDKEMKFGYAVTGIVHPDKVVRNSGARPGDALVLTKAIGTGAINTAIKRGVASPETEAAAVRTMTISAAEASKVMQRLGANGCTDVTGFGLLGHAFEMAKGSGVTINIDSKRVPLLPDVLELISQGMLTRGDRNNRTYVGETVKIAPSVSVEMQSALFDPQTAGGLLISMTPENAERFVAEVEGSVIIGNVTASGKYCIEVS